MMVSGMVLTDRLFASLQVLLVWRMDALCVMPQKEQEARLLLRDSNAQFQSSKPFIFSL